MKSRVTNEPAVFCDIEKTQGTIRFLGKTTMVLSNVTLDEIIILTEQTR